VNHKARIVVFGASQIRRVWFDEQSYFSVVDIVGALTESAKPAKILGCDEAPREKCDGR